MKTEYENIDQYIQNFPEPVQKMLQLARETIHATAPEAEEAIRYGMPTFRLHDKNLVHFAAFTHHFGFYPAPQALEEFKVELSKYKGTKGAVQFPLDEPLPVGLIKRITEYRMKVVSEDAGYK